MQRGGGRRRAGYVRIGGFTAWFPAYRGTCPGERTTGRLWSFSSTDRLALYCFLVLDILMVGDWLDGWEDVTAGHILAPFRKARCAVQWLKRVAVRLRVSSHGSNGRRIWTNSACSQNVLSDQAWSIGFEIVMDWAIGQLQENSPSTYQAHINNLGQKVVSETVRKLQSAQQVSQVLQNLKTQPRQRQSAVRGGCGVGAAPRASTICRAATPLPAPALHCRSSRPALPAAVAAAAGCFQEGMRCCGIVGEEGERGTARRRQAGSTRDARPRRGGRRPTGSGPAQGPLDAAPLLARCAANAQRLSLWHRRAAGAGVGPPPAETG
jgi:hypothetical protein